MSSPSVPNSRPGLSLIEDEYWYAGPISERKSEQILSDLGEAGCFLVRDCLLPDADYVLSVSSGKEIWHYDVKVLPNNECVFNNYSFSSLPDAIDFYTENRLGTVFLNEPKGPIIAPSQNAKHSGPVIKRVGSGNAVKPRSTVTTKPQMQVTSDHVDDDQPPKFEEHAWQSQSSSQAGYSPALSQNSNSGPTGHIVSLSAGDDVKSQSSSSRSQTSEVDTTYIVPSNNIESVYIHPPDTDHKDHERNATDKDSPVDLKGEDGTEFCETSFDSDIEDGNDPKIAASTHTPDSKNEQHSKSVAPEVATKPRKKSDELMELPSIGDKMLELEKRAGGESDSKQGRPRSPLPPAVPKRVSSISNVQNPMASEPAVEPEPEKATTKSSPLRTPKRISIPEMFLEKPSEDQIPPKSPGATPKRIEIPSSLELMPPPPPMSTHPGLASKAREEEVQEKPPVQMAKKRRSFIKIKKRNSKREKRSSLTTEEPTLLGSEKSTSVSSPTQDEPPPAPRRLSGVPTPALSPGAIGGEGGELKNKFKSITKQQWNPDTFETKDTDPSSSVVTVGQNPVSTFGHTSPVKQSNQRPPPESVITPPVSPEHKKTTPTPRSKTVSSPVVQEPVKHMKGTDCVDGDEPLEGVSTFLPQKKSQPVLPTPQPKEETGPTLASTKPTTNSSSNISSGHHTIENGVAAAENRDTSEHVKNGLTDDTENGVTDTQPGMRRSGSSSIADLVPGVKQPVSPVKASPGVVFPSKSTKPQMPPGFAIVAPTQPLPPLSTAQRRFTTSYVAREAPSSKPSVPTPAAPGPMNTKRGGGGLKKRKSMIFKNKS